MNFYRDGLKLNIDDAPIISRTREGHTVEKYLVNGVEKYFVTIAGSHYCAHGSTIAEAVADAIWKDEKRRPSLEVLKKEIKDAGKDRKITLQEFRVLTGACLEGCRLELKRKKLDGSPMTAHEVYKHFPEWGAKLLEILEWKK